MGKRVRCGEGGFGLIFRFEDVLLVFVYFDFVDVVGGDEDVDVNGDEDEVDDEEGG